jgi:hypothetical protein
MFGNRVTRKPLPPLGFDPARPPPLPPLPQAPKPEPGGSGWENFGVWQQAAARWAAMPISEPDRSCL